ncbi:MAG: toxin regulator [Terrisporobacter sp.]
MGVGCSGSSVSQEDYDVLSAQYKSLDNRYNDILKQNKELQEKVDEAAPWFEMSEQERKNEEERIKKEQEKLEKEQAEKAEKERKEKEEQEKKEQAEKEKKEKQGYDTGITYSQLARTPDEYMLQKIKFQGKVIQVMEGDGVVQVRLAVGGNYDNIILCEYDSLIVSSRVLEDDYITVYGLSAGIMTYTSTMGGEITIPSMLVDKIDIK